MWSINRRLESTKVKKGLQMPFRSLEAAFLRFSIPDCNLFRVLQYSVWSARLIAR